MAGARSWHEIRKKWEEIYSPTVTEAHAASDLYGKQWTDETLQDYIQNCIDLTEKSHGSRSNQYHI